MIPALVRIVFEVINGNLPWVTALATECRRSGFCRLAAVVTHDRRRHLLGADRVCRHTADTSIGGTHCADRQHYGSESEEIIAFHVVPFCASLTKVHGPLDISVPLAAL